MWYVLLAWNPDITATSVSTVALSGIRNLFKKAQGSVVLNRIGMKFDRNVLQPNTHRLAESDFRFAATGLIFKMAAMTSFNAEKCCHLASEQKASGQRQFLIYSTSVLVYIIKLTFSDSNCMLTTSMKYRPICNIDKQ